jgi:hypothetical protein
MSYDSLIKEARLVNKIESTTTTGDVEYDGTALEICDERGEDMFHIIVDMQGERQILFFAREENYRLPLKLMEEIISKAHEVVRKV